ncbi:MAG: hypothetical protein H0U87_12170 [Acidobacteria bacterium]|nr:hypothetical protein [Acidobacteriota bacterium]
MKRLHASVAANDLTQAGFIKSVAAIENNGEILSDEDVEMLLQDAYVPARYDLQNESLLDWFNETDARWFDNVRRNIEKLPSHVLQAVALSIGIGVGDYVLSFDRDTRELRQPLSDVFMRLWSIFPAPVDNNQINVCKNKSARDFVAENFGSDLMFLRLPRAQTGNGRKRLGWTAWREEWTHGDARFWTDFERASAGKLGAAVETKSQYLRLLEEFLQIAAHIPVWAIAHIEDGFLPTQEIAEIVARIRRVDTIYTKDFSELSRAKAVIITA